MKKTLTISAFYLAAFSAFCQNSLKLEINHKLGTSPFALNQAATNNLGHDFKLGRLQYYMSGFVITHDGAQTTSLTGVYALVDASSSDRIDLGNYPGITNVEAIKFSIGVNTPENNADPSLWPSTHALAPKSPSMHWGWASGYFFIALSGNSSPSLNQTLELHTLGNVNYFSQTIQTTATMDGNDKVISIDADYELALKNIAISSGLVQHGSSGANSTMVNNFKNYVFSAKPVNPVGLTENETLNGTFSVYPNPSDNGTFTLSSSLKGTGYRFQIADVTGKIIESGAVNDAANKQFSIHSGGIYFVSLLNGNATVSVEKLIVR